MNSCEYCGSVLDADGNHTDEWVRSWRHGKNWRRPQMYRVWSAMKTRCTNPNHNSYKYYGARGLKICDEWSDYAVFRQWMIDQGFKPGLKIDRIDNDVGYYPWNCRLATDRQQMQNRRLPGRHKHGKRYNNTDLTEADIMRIVRSRRSTVSLGEEYDIHPSTVTRLRERYSAEQGQKP